MHHAQPVSMVNPRRISVSLLEKTRLTRVHEKLQLHSCVTRDTMHGIVEVHIEILTDPLLRGGRQRKQL